jgi:hypothetical protein
MDAADACCESIFDGSPVTRRANCHGIFAREPSQMDRRTVAASQSWHTIGRVGRCNNGETHHRDWVIPRIVD